MAELLFDAFETIFPRLCPLFRLAGDWIVAFVVPALRLRRPVVAITRGFVGVMLPGLAIFSSFADTKEVPKCRWALCGTVFWLAWIRRAPWGRCNILVSSSTSPSKRWLFRRRVSISLLASKYLERGLAARTFFGSCLCFKSKPSVTEKSVYL